MQRRGGELYLVTSVHSNYIDIGSMNLHRFVASHRSIWTPSSNERVLGARRPPREAPELAVAGDALLIVGEAARCQVSATRNLQLLIERTTLAKLERFAALDHLRSSNAHLQRVFVGLHAAKGKATLGIGQRIQAEIR